VSKRFRAKILIIGATLSQLDTCGVCRWTELLGNRWRKKGFGLCRFSFRFIS